jgi:hypothetical protein
MLLRRQHKDREYQLRRKYHLYNHTLSDGSSSSESRADCEIALEECLDDVGCDYPPHDLDYEEEDPADPGYGADEDHAYCYLFGGVSSQSQI